GPHETFQCQPINKNFYNSNSLGFDQSQPPQFPVIHQPPHEMSIKEMEDLKQQYLDEMKRLINSKYRDEIKIDEFKGNFNITPSLSTEEPDNSLSMGDEHLDTISATKSDEFIKSSVEILSQSQDFSNSNDEFSSTNDDSFSIDNIDYVEASPPDSELVSSEVMEIVIPEVGGIDDDILLTIKDDILQISSGSTTTHSDSSLYDSFIFDLLINPFPPADRSDFYEFADELTHIISPPEYDCFFFKIEPNSGNFTMDCVEDISPTREPRVHNALPTHPIHQLNLEFKLSRESLFTYVYSQKYEDSRQRILYLSLHFLSLNLRITWKEIKKRTKSEQNRIKSRSDGKRRKARQCQSPVTVKKAEKEKKIQTKRTKNGKP
nr:hypothetical protein [Tanacetum cinerariifolium]